MPKVSDNHKLARREQILSAAVKCFISKGFHLCTMQDICREAQLSPGAVYSYFTSKDEIIQSMSEASIGQQEALFAEIDVQNGSVLDALMHVKTFYFNQLTENPDAKECIRMDSMLLAEGFTDSKIKQKYQHNLAGLINKMSGLIELGKTNGEVKTEVDARSAAQALYALHHGLSVQLLLDQAVDMTSYHQVLDSMINSLFVNTVS